ncbi:TRAP transporter small permease [Plastorhodobacter daqingensis]|uniref:TRAP transporter small permease protein n=1 Tax=Plastorhodobacter daqingensis TaxID=1387281 RepID=A0ABW2ULZ1_9RHOB
MGVLLRLLTPLRITNDILLAAGRALGILAVAAMVAAILLQVFFRYALNNALPWPDEAARFLMLWMTGLMAPTALRRGGFVAIDMGVRMLPPRIGALLSLALLGLMMAVLVVAFRIGWSEVTGIGGRFTTTSLYYPTGAGWAKVPRAWMMMSLHVGVCLMLLVNAELILRGIIALAGGAARLPPIPGATAGAE